MNHRVVSFALLFLFSLSVAVARPTVAVVLEGGGALGLAHVGIIKAIEEVGIPVDIVVGTSMGSIIGGIWALGYDSTSLEKIVRTTQWFDLLDEKPPFSLLTARERERQRRSLMEVGFDARGIKTNGGLLSGKKIVAYLDQLAAQASAPDDFDQFPRRFRAVAADVDTGERVEISQGRLADAMRASMAIPGLFSPYELQGRYLVDGGIVGNLPVATAKALGADLVIAVHLTAVNPIHREDFARTPTAALSRSVDILISENVQRELAMADLELDVDLGDASAADFSRAGTIVDRGIAAGLRLKPQLVDFLARIDAPKAAPLSVPQGPVVTKLEVTGVPPQEQAFIRQTFAPVLGQPIRSDQLLVLYLELFSRSNYTWVRFRTLGTSDGTILQIEVTPAPRPNNTLQLGLQYSATYSALVTSQGALTPGATFWDLTGEGSRFSVDAEVLETPGLQVEYEQPLSWNTFGLVYGNIQHESETYFAQSSFAYQYQIDFRRVGVDFGIVPFSNLEVRTGLVRDWIGNSNWPNISPSIQVASTTGWVASTHYEDTDSNVSSTRGWEISTRYLDSLTPLGSQRPFQTLETNGSLTFPVTSQYFISFLWRVGTDFSGGTDSIDAAPPLNRPTLSDRRLFPGPFYLDDQVGDTVWALGLEGKHRWSMATGVFGIPVYTLVQVASGVASQGAWNRTPGLFGLDATLNGSLGLGIQLSDGEGLAIRGGLIRKSDTELLPFLSVDLGSRVF